MAAAYMTPAETARALRISRSGVLWMVDTRRLRAVRTDTGRRLVLRRDVERLCGERDKRRDLHSNT